MWPPGLKHSFRKGMIVKLKMSKILNGVTSFYPIQATPTNPPLIRIIISNHGRKKDSNHFSSNNFRYDIRVTNHESYGEK